MRTPPLVAGLLATGLAASVGLRPQDIALQCVSMCGPMVELAAKCRPPTLPRRGLAVDDASLVQRNVRIIIAAPNKNPSGQTTTTTIRPVRTSIVYPKLPATNKPFTPVLSAPTPPSFASTFPLFATTSLLPSTSSDPLQLDPAPPTTRRPITFPLDATAQPTETPGSTSLATTTAVASTPLRTPSTAPPRAPAVGDADTRQLDAEEQCVCLNKSFDVPKVAALCASCIAQSGDDQNNVNVIMSRCMFPPLEYSPGNESVVSNVHVVAMLGSQRGVVNMAPSDKTISSSAAWTIACVLAALLITI
ncbi:hypothetical protein CDD82_7094 [Ophiocordyceps australis]|uniref:Extracellular membrane protein CFEM domain-containing protein n=1 Tax=Ophiocordyceps australis TaxID=1399860 RepID=A0A2C5YLS6_9HYPO|nr:hypothetical protein CDD82_7094 [Ophiocordyceps australis]